MLSIRGHVKGASGSETSSTRNCEHAIQNPAHTGPHSLLQNAHNFGKRCFSHTAHKAWKSPFWGNSGFHRYGHFEVEAENDSWLFHASARHICPLHLLCGWPISVEFLYGLLATFLPRCIQTTFKNIYVCFVLTYTVQ